MHGDYRGVIARDRVCECEWRRISRHILSMIDWLIN